MQAAELGIAAQRDVERASQFVELGVEDGAFARRALIEQAKGILMARNNIDAEHAYELLKTHSQQSGKKLSEIAKAITDSHTFFPAEPPPNSNVIPGRFPGQEPVTRQDGT